MIEYREPLTRRQREILAVIAKGGMLPVPGGPRRRPFHALAVLGYAEIVVHAGMQMLRITDAGRVRHMDESDV